MKERVKDFAEHICTIKWFEKCGEAAGEYTVESSIFSAYDDWGDNMLKVWEPHIVELEELSRGILSEGQIDEVFELISECIGDELWLGFCDFFDRNNLEEEAGLENEIMDFVKRDMSWACVESLLDKRGFFHNLLKIYEQGRWPCSWDGDYPNGKFVVM